MEHKSELDRVEFLMRYFMDWWTELHEAERKIDPIDYDTIDGTPIIPTEYARRRFSDLKQQCTTNAPSRNLEGAQQPDSEMKSRVEASFYSEEEIERMPKLKDGRFRITKDGLWQVRYRRDGYDIQFTCKQKKVVIDRFRAWVQSVNETNKAVQPKKKYAFIEFAEWYFENVKRVNVEKQTYETQHRCAELHIYPIFGELTMRQITPAKCQELLNGLLAQEKGRTAEAVKFLLGEILHAAVGQKYIAENPMQYVKIPRHIRTNGTALSLDEVADFLQTCERSPYRKQFAVYLYTGIRRDELHSLQIEGDFISVICGKCRKGQRKRRRKIPIPPALRPFLPLSAGELAVKNDVLTGNFKNLCPAHHLNNLRHTYITRCLECGISKTLVDVWTDHIDKKDMTEGIYTHFSEEFQLAEIKKLTF